MLLCQALKHFWVILDFCWHSLGEKQQAQNICLFFFLLSLNAFLEQLMSLPEITIVKHFCQLPADRKNSFYNSSENSICPFHFWWIRRWKYVFLWRWCYSSTFNLCSPNSCINKFNLLYGFIPLALSGKLSRSVINVWVIAG